MAPVAGAKTATRPVAIPSRVDAEADATPRLARASARNRSHRRVVKNRRRLHRRALNASRVARGNSVCPRAPARIALRARTNLQVRDPAKTKTTLRRQNHPRRPLPRRLIWKICGANKPGADQATFKKEKEVVRRGENFAD
jgi:hypothetical protein